MAQQKRKTADQVKRRAPIQVKATETTEDGAGVVSGVASVWDNVDSYGDVMLKGAFADTIQEHADAGNRIPFVWGHETQDPFAYLGELTEVRETDEGLAFEAALDMDNPKAVQVYKLLKARRVRDLSFGFIPRDTSPSERDGVEVREVKSVELLEVSAVHVGANRAARVTEVRSQKAPEDTPDGDTPDGDTPAGGSEDDPQDGEDVTLSAEQFADLVAAAAALSQAADTLVGKLADVAEGAPADSGTDGKAAASSTPGRHEDRSGGKCSQVGETAAAREQAVLTEARMALAIIEADGVLDQ